MSITIDTTIGGSASNSFASIAELDAIFELRPFSSEWTLTATSDELEDQKRFAIQATTLMNDFNWLGSRVTTTQALAHPRVGLQKRDGVNFYSGGYGHSGNYNSGYWGWGNYYLPTEIAQPVKQAQAEIILTLKRDGENGLIATGGSDAGAINGFSLGDVSVNGRGTTIITMHDLIMSPRVSQILTGLLTTAQRVRA